eukprot:gene4765-5392_t
MAQLKGEIAVFSIIGCPFCIRAKAKLEELGLPFIDFNLDRVKSARETMIEKTGRKTVPQIFFNGKHIGGWNDFKNLSQEDLDKLIKDVTTNEVPEGQSFKPLIEKESDFAESGDSFDFTCELDEYAFLKKELQESGIVKDLRNGLKVYKTSFLGKDAVNWLVTTKNLDRGHAIEMCKQLVEKHFGHSVKDKGQIEFRDDDTIYRFLDDDQSNALNSEASSSCEPRSDTQLAISRRFFAFSQTLALEAFHVIWRTLIYSWRFLKTQGFFLTVPLNEGPSTYTGKKIRKAGEVGEELRKLILSIYSSHLSTDGTKVDYKAIGESSEFAQYVQHTAELKRVNVENATREEKIAFFVNVYNALVIHAFVERGPPTNLWQRYKGRLNYNIPYSLLLGGFRFFNVVSYVIGGYTYSLNEIENGILRSNRKPIGSFRKPFSKNDPRVSIILDTPEPRVHFALVCGAKSCPPIKTYNAKEIDKQLNLATESFLEGDGCIVDMTKREVKLSRILKWYQEDFGKTKQAVLKWVIENMGECEKKRQLGLLLDGNNFKLGHLSYDWSLNSS